MDLNNLNKLLPLYWTAKKCGKHDGLSNQHGMLLLKNLKVDPNTYFEQVKSNTFTFMPFGKISWSEFLKRSKLAEYLKSEYINDALNITTARPAIGKGEFLFASCFNNIGFSETAGDLVDLETGKKIEFKGIKANMSGDGKIYKQLNKSVLYSLFSLFNTSDGFEHFNKECAKKIDELLAKNPDKINKVLEILQNINKSSSIIANEFAKLYKTHNDIFSIVGAMQLYMYLHLQKASYLLMTNDQGFCCFETPETPEEAYNIITNIKLSTWYTGTNSMSIGI